MTLGPSDHLTWEELACHDGAETPYPEKWRDTRLVVLARVFEVIREASGSRPIAILSAYRTPAHNEAIGGAKGSQHVQGRALDLKHGMLSAQKLGALIRGLADSTLPEIGGVGQYATFVHVDVRPRNNGHLTTWTG